MDVSVEDDIVQTEEKSPRGTVRSSKKSSRATVKGRSTVRSPSPETPTNSPRGAPPPGRKTFAKQGSVKDLKRQTVNIRDEEETSQRTQKDDWFTLLVFSGCSHDFILRLYQTANREVLKAGEVVLEEGATTNDLIVVDKGSLIWMQNNIEIRVVHQGQCPTSLAVLGLYQINIGHISAHPENGAIVRRLSEEQLMRVGEAYPSDAKVVRQYAKDLTSCNGLLKNVALFKHFHEMELKEAFFWLLSEWSIRKTMQQEEIIISQGQEGESAMYVVESGTAAVEFDFTQAFRQTQAFRASAGESGTASAAFSATMSTTTSVRKKFIKSLSKTKKLDELPEASTVEKKEILTAIRKTEYQKKDVDEPEASTRTGTASGTASETLRMQQLGAGAVFGELAMLGISKSRSATLKVSSSIAVVLEIHREVLLRLLQLFPKEKQVFEEMIEKLAVQHLSGLGKEVKIRDAPPFRTCTPEFCEALQNSCEHRAVLPGTMMMQEGEEGTGILYLVHQGELQVEILGKVVGELGEGDCFGEATLLNVSPTNTATVRTVTLSSLLMLHRDAFNLALSQFPRERKYFEDMIQARMVNMDERFDPLESAFFKNCHRDFSEEIRKNLHLEVFMPDQVLVNEGDVGTSMFILSTGKAVISVKGQQVAEAEEGSVFGELTLLGIASRRTATITANTVCLVEKLHQHAFELALAKYPEERRCFEELARQNLGNNCDYSVYRWPFFQTCPSRFLYLLDLHIGRSVYFSTQTIVEVKPEDLFDDNSSALSMFVILQGNAGVFENGVKIKDLRDRDVFGEMTVIGVPTEPHITLVAETMCDVNILPKSIVEEAFQQFPEERTRFQEKLAIKIVEAAVQEHGSGVNSLQHTKLFKDATEDFRQYIWDHLETCLFLPGSNIVQEGDTSEPCMYILRRGNAAVLVKGNVVHEYVNGNYFGELGLLGIASKRTATIQAKTLTVVQILHRPHFQEALANFPENESCFSSLQAQAEGHLDSYLRRTVGNLPIFENSDSRFLDAICEKVEEQRYSPGDIIVNEDEDTTHQVMILISGKLTVSSKGVWTGEIWPGELALFGEISAVSALGSHGWKAATVKAGGRDPCIVVTFEGDGLNKALRDYPAELVKFQDIDRNRHKKDSMKLKDHQAWVQATERELRDKVTFFSFCSGALILTLVNHVEENVFPPNRILAEDKAPAQTLLVLLDGTADVLVENICLGNLTSGAVFGEESVFGFPWRTSTLQARTACRTLSLNTVRLWEVLKSEEFSEEHKFFMDLKEHREEAARRLQDLPLFATCDTLCLQQIALHASPSVVQTRTRWAPGKRR